jgi:DNA-binding transcriptional LysR family regulator
MPRPISRPPLDARRVDLLESVEREGTISAAAEALNFTCSALSQQLRQLEGEIGVELVHRTPRAATLTPAGRVLLEHGVFLRSRLQSAEDELREISKLKRGRLRIGTFRSAGETLVADAISYFRAHWPGVELTLTEGEPEQCVPMVRANELDVALTFDYDGVEPRADERLVVSRICDDEMVLVLPVGHRLTALDSIPLETLRGERWITSTPHCSVAAFTERACQLVGFSPDIAMSTDDYRVAQALVACGSGVTFLPRLAAHLLNPGCVVRTIADLRLTRRIYVAHRVGGERAPAVRRILEVLDELGADASA